MQIISWVAEQPSRASGAGAACNLFSVTSRGHSMYASASTGVSMILAGTPWSGRSDLYWADEAAQRRSVVEYLFLLPNAVPDTLRLK